jgi:hypothetical protein
MTATQEVLEFDDLTPYLYVKNGNLLYKVPFRGGWAVLKVYYGSRGTLETWAKSMGNVLFEGQTSYLPKTRMRMERDCLLLWREHGIRTFEVYEDVVVKAPLEQCPPDGYLLLEYVKANTLELYMADRGVPEEERFETYRRWLADWCRRHEIAEAEREPRLVHENGDAGHVMLIDEDPGFLWFDFEMVFRSRSKVPEFIGHEVVQYLWHLLRNTPTEIHERLLLETARHYPNRERLKFAPRVFLDHPRFLMRLGRGIDARRKRGKKPTSKYNVGRKLWAAIEQVEGE